MFKIISKDLAENPAIQSVWYDIDTVVVERALAGVGVLTGCGVTAQGSPDMTLAVAAGTIQPSFGAAAVAVTSGNVTIGAAHATLPRVDLVSASAAGVKTVTAGTAASSPKPPDLPSGHIALALILVPQTVTSITTARISDRKCSPVRGGLTTTQIGTTSLGASFDTTLKRVYKKITLATAGYLASIAIGVKGQSSGGVNIVAGIMSDNAGTPLNVLAVGGTGSSRTVGGVHTTGATVNATARFVTVPIGVPLAAGDYWIAVMPAAPSGSDVQLAHAAGTGSDRTLAGTDGLYDHSVAASSAGTNDYSIYANVLS